MLRILAHLTDWCAYTSNDSSVANILFNKHASVIKQAGLAKLIIHSTRNLYSRASSQCLAD
jgi:hypothetical protein